MPACTFALRNLTDLCRPFYVAPQIIFHPKHTIYYYVLLEVQSFPLIAHFVMAELATEVVGASENVVSVLRACTHVKGDATWSGIWVD